MVITLLIGRIPRIHLYDEYSTSLSDRTSAGYEILNAFISTLFVNLFTYVMTLSQPVGKSIWRYPRMKYPTGKTVDKLETLSQDNRISAIGIVDSSAQITKYQTDKETNKAVNISPIVSFYQGTIP